MQYKNGAIYIKPEKIIKPTIVAQFNKFKKDHTYFLAGRVTLSGRWDSAAIGKDLFNGTSGNACKYSKIWRG